MKTMNVTKLKVFAVAIALLVSLPALVTAASASLDPTFGLGGRVIYAPAPVFGVVRRVRIQPDGKIVSFGGQVTNFGPSFITRHNTNGTLDTSFGTNGQVNTPTDFNQYFSDFVLASNGNLIVTGNMQNIFADIATGFLTYDPSGNRSFPNADASWDDAPGRRLLVQGDGALVVIAAYGLPNNATRELVAIRYSADAESLDESFGNRSLANSNISIWGHFEYWSDWGAEFIGDGLIQPDGKILMTGYGAGGGKIIRLKPNGSLDTGFGSNGVAYLPDYYNHPSGILIQPDGKIVLNGVWAEFGLYSSFVLRFNPNGSLDTEFGTNGLVSIPEPDPDSRGIGVALAIQPNGKIITAGERNGGFAMMRFDQSGSIDATFGTNGVLTTQMGNAPRAAILSLAWQSDGKLVAAGSVGNTHPTSLGLARYSFPAAEIEVSGRVVSPTGSPIRNALVTLMDAQHNRRTVRTSPFGIFRFNNVTPDATYTIWVSSKRFSFAPRMIHPTGNLVVTDLVGVK